MVLRVASLRNGAETRPFDLWGLLPLHGDAIPAALLILPVDTPVFLRAALFLLGLTSLQKVLPTIFPVVWR